MHHEIRRAEAARRPSANLWLVQGMATATAQIATRVVVGEGGVVKEERDRSSRPRRGSSLTENPLQLSSPEKKLAAAPVSSPTKGMNVLTEEQLGEIAGALRSLSDLRKLGALNAAVGPHAVTCDQIAKLVETTDSEHVKLTMVQVLAPRCADPRHGEAIADTFAEASQRQQCHDSFAARSRKIDIDSRFAASSGAKKHRSRSVLERRVAAARAALAESKASLDAPSPSGAGAKKPPAFSEPVAPPEPEAPAPEPEADAAPPAALASVPESPPTPATLATRLFEPGSPTSPATPAAPPKTNAFATPPKKKSSEKAVVSFRIEPSTREQEEAALERCKILASETKMRLASSRMLIEKDKEIAANYNDLMCEAAADFGNEAEPPAVPWYGSCTGFVPFLGCATPDKQAAADAQQRRDAWGRK